MSGNQAEKPGYITTITGEVQISISTNCYPGWSSESTAITTLESCDNVFNGVRSLVFKGDHGKFGSSSGGVVSSWRLGPGSMDCNDRIAGKLRTKRVSGDKGYPKGGGSCIKKGSR